jgi:hypothetical protein
LENGRGKKKDEEEKWVGERERVKKNDEIQRSEKDE